jgi:hypothetical protein
LTVFVFGSICKRGFDYWLKKKRAIPAWGGRPQDVKAAVVDDKILNILLAELDTNDGGLTLDKKRDRPDVWDKDLARCVFKFDVSHKV